MLTQLDRLPAGLLELQADQLHDAIGGPTLIMLPGRDPQPLFISVLMHGNETSGWEAVRGVLNKYSNGDQALQLPRSIMLFIGNTLAAKHNVRHLADQRDFNRVWPGGELPACPEQALMLQVTNLAAQQAPFASIDLHNNTGLNPHYACVNTLAHQNLQLATLFNRTVVYFTQPKGVQSMAFSQFCPAVTLECGRVGDDLGLEHAFAFIDACLNLSEIPDRQVATHDLDLFHTAAIVKIRESVRFGYEGNELDLLLEKDLDHYNFRALAVGTKFGSVNNGLTAPFTVSNRDGEDVYQHYFESVDGEIRTRLEVMPSMLTLNEEVIQQDCLCYLMERYPTPGIDCVSESA